MTETRDEPREMEKEIDAVLQKGDMSVRDNAIVMIFAMDHNRREHLASIRSPEFNRNNATLFIQASQQLKDLAIEWEKKGMEGLRKNTFIINKEYRECPQQFIDETVEAISLLGLNPKVTEGVATSLTGKCQKKSVMYVDFVDGEYFYRVNPMDGCLSRAREKKDIKQMRILSAVENLLNKAQEVLKTREEGDNKETVGRLVKIWGEELEYLKGEEDGKEKKE